MKQFFIPSLGTEIVLAKDWKFVVQNEYRNQSLFDWLEEPMKGIRLLTMLPKGTRLVIDRIYIRKNLSEFDSVTFTAPDLIVPAKTLKRFSQEFIPDLDTSMGVVPGRKIPYTIKKPSRRVRFWVPLVDANRIIIK